MKFLITHRRINKAFFIEKNHSHPKSAQSIVKIQLALI